MQGKYLACALIGAVWAYLIACEGTIDQNGDGDGDGDTDADGDADSGDDGCSMNSGAYCTCDMPWEGTCDDGTFCLSVRNLEDTGNLGICSPSCDCGDDSYNHDCDDTPFGATARCVLAGDWPIVESTRCNCVLWQCETADDCPPGQQCHEIIGQNGPFEGVTL